MNEQNDDHIHHTEMVSHLNRKKNYHTCKMTSRQPASQTSSQPDKQPDRQTDRQTDSQPASQPASQCSTNQMHYSMSFKSHSRYKFFCTNIAFKWFNSSMTSHVSLQFLLCAEWPITFTTLEWFITSVNSLNDIIT